MLNSKIIGIASIAFMVLVFLLAIVGAKPAAIAIGTIVLPVIFVVIAIIAGVSGYRNRSRATGDADFSSFSPAEERTFLPFERLMQNNGRRAARLGLGLAAIGFVVGSLVVAILYTPCARYCERPPTSCRNDIQSAEWKRTCDSACAGFERQHGKDFVETLTGCAFANSTAGKCDVVTKAATSVGLWCEAKN